MKLNARGEVTQKYRKAALLDRELERGNEEEKNLQADAVAHEARVAAAARTAGRRRRLVGDDLRRVTLAFDGRAAGAPTAALGAAFELTLPKSWDDRPCSKLLKHFAKTYAVKYPSEPPLRVKGLELLRNDGAAVALDALIGDEVGGRGAPEELVVAFTAAGGSAANAPVVLVLGEVETYAGLAGEHEPKFVTPSFVKAVWLEDGSSQPSGFAAGASPDARMDLCPDRGAYYYPLGSSCLKYEKRVVKGSGAARDLAVAGRGWADVEAVVRNALLMARLHCAKRHVVCVVPSRATIKLRASLVAFFFEEHGAASVCVAPLAACAMALRVPVSGWRGTACVVECGHDSSCAQAYVEGVLATSSWTPRGGEGVAKLFASLVARATPEAAARPGAKTLADPCRAHALLLAKKELCFARSLVEDAPETIRGRVPLPDGADAAVSEECYLATELLFARQDECPLPALAAAPPLHICAADAIKRVGDRRLHRPLLAGVIVTGCDDACHEGCDVRVAQELGNLLRGTVRVVASRARAWDAAAAFAAALADGDAHAKWVVSRSDYDAMVAARGVYAKDGSGDDGGGDDVVPMKRASGAVGPPGVDEIVEEHALTDTRAALDAKSLPRCEIARAE